MGGSLVVRGEDCSAVKKPLCLRIDNANDTALSEACAECNSGGNTADSYADRCICIYNKPDWVQTGLRPPQTVLSTNLHCVGAGCLSWAALAGLDSSLPSTQLCVAPCGQTRGQADTCQVRHSSSIYSLYIIHQNTSKYIKIFDIHYTSKYINIKYTSIMKQLAWK